MIRQINVLNKSLTFVKSFMEFISCIWTTQYYEPGEFELVVEYSTDNWNALKVGNYLVKNNTNEIAVIEKVKYSFSPNEGGIITASGKMAISLLDRRLIYAYTHATGKPTIILYCNGNIEDECRATVASVAVSGSAQNNRVLNGLVLGTDKGFTETAYGRVSTYQNCYNALTSLLATRWMAHRIIYENGELKYEVYKGTDRSSSMVFSRYLQNLLSFSYEVDKSEFKNCLYVGGDGEGTDRIVTSVYVNEQGQQIDRYEGFYSASSNREENQSVSSYITTIANEAKQYSNDFAMHKSVEAEIDLVNSGLEFGKDYNVGDIILIRDIIDFTPRITTVIESQSADGYTIDVEFNEDAPEEEDE